MTRDRIEPHRFPLSARLLLIASASAALSILGATAAVADCHGDGDDSGSGTTHVGAGGSYQFMGWELGGTFHGRGVRVVSNTGSGMSTNICLDAYVDWETTYGHFDRRAARNCDPGTYRESDSGGDGWQPDDYWGSRILTGLQKAAGCKYVQVDTSPPPTPTPYIIDCDYVPESESGCPFTASLAWTDKSQRTWVRHEDGTIDYNNAGDVDDPNQ